MKTFAWTPSTLEDAIDGHARMAAWVLVHTGDVKRATQHARACDRLTLVADQRAALRWKERAA